MRKTIAERFWSKVDIPLDNDGKQDEDECWLWTAGIFNSGYGSFWIDGKNLKANRIAYRLDNGEFDETKCVLHKCDTPGCCNPGHLWLGTQNDNMQDCKNKGRRTSGDQHYSRTNPEKLARGDRSGARTHPEKLARGDNHYSRLHPESRPRGDKHYSRINPEKIRGENNNNSKLIWKQVKEIRASPDKQQVLADRYGVRQSTIWNIKNNKTWKESEVSSESS